MSNSSDMFLQHVESVLPSFRQVVKKGILALVVTDAVLQEGIQNIAN